MLPAGMRVYVACGVTDMRKGFDGLAALVQTALALGPYVGALFVFRGKRGDLLKALVWDGQGLERVDIHRVQMNALMTDSMDRNARGVCS